jgi:hypothetical protein
MAQQSETLQTYENSMILSRILSSVEVASRCGKAISINEIDLLLPIAQKPSSLRQIIQSDPYVSKSVSIENDFVVLKGYEHLFSNRALREEVAKKYLEIAKTFVGQLIRRCSHGKLIAVCGSVAYGSAVASDDIDLFIITRENRMWLFFLKALLLARACNIKASITGEKANFCLSYVQDEKYFEEEIKHHITPLIAREFLSIRVLTGINYYITLLDRSKWICEMFPKLYASKLDGRNEDKTKQIENRLQFAVNDISNLFIYEVLKVFLSFKALLRNLRYRKEGKMRDIFEAMITKGACAYTSVRYRQLEKTYDTDQSFGRENHCSKWSKEKK